MTIKDMIAVLQAAERGEEVEYKTTAGWHECGSPIWDFGTWEYRIKPKPHLVPLEPSDVPPGSVIKWTVGVVSYRTTLEVNSEGVVVIMGNGPTCISWERLQRECLISRDGGRTWAKCEKEAK